MSVSKIIILPREKIYLQVIIQKGIKISKHVSTKMINRTSLTKIIITKVCKKS